MCRRRAGVDAVQLLWLRHLGVGDLGCAAARWAAGGGARVGGGSPERVPRPARQRTGQPSCTRPRLRWRCCRRRAWSRWRWWWAARRVPAEVVDRWAPGRVMLNAYGPTETTMWCDVQCAVDSGRRVCRRSVRRCPGRRCSCSMAGCGRCRPGWSASCTWPVPRVGCGYVRRAALTASRFVACPFGRARDTDVSHRGSGALARRRAAAVSRARR